MDEVVRKFIEAGVRFTLEPFDATGGVRIAFFKDPDGILIELVRGRLKLLPYEGSAPLVLKRASVLEVRGIFNPGCALLSVAVARKLMVSQTSTSNTARI